MSETKVEFAVQMSGTNCESEIRNSLLDCGKIEVDLKDGRVVVHSTLPWYEVQNKIESTGRRAVLSGFGGSSAVAIVDKGQPTIKGVIRFTSLDEKTNIGCCVDGVIDGLKPGEHGLHIHECGDISQGCESLGGHYNPLKMSHGSRESTPDLKHAGDLGNIQADETGRAVFKFNDSYLKVWDIIGRSIVVTENSDDLGKCDNSQSLIDGNSGKRLACGIIARAAGIFQNYKKICACDGVTLWEERDRPLAGAKRREKSSL